MTFRTFRSALALLCALVSMGTLSVFAVSYPITTPAGEETGGYFYKWFVNMFDNPCGPNQVIRGFTPYNAAVPYAPTYGTPICVEVASSSGAASTLTGGLM